ncbi:MAG: site-specific DNA-methyltransferase [Sulfurimonas sp.]|nr:site-specific DNA-methyltransferase [Sulfurimonas sp.]
MKKLDMKTTEITEENIDKLEAIFPHCITEVKEEDGTITRGVDFNLLKQEFSSSVVEGPRESYSINWPGKKASLISANTPINKTLRPCREESVNFDTTENLYIEGDNLEALKLLQESYLGKVKMIYIDPPYNTGKDFVYKDNYTRSEKEELEKSGQIDEDGGKLIANSESNGRFHSDWLSMMYPRLRLARRLLQDDGVIFISIDDNEVTNLKKICDEVFGNENFMAEFIWKKRTGSNDSKNMVSLDQDYIIAYTKTTGVALNGILKDSSNYKNPDNDSRGPWASDNLTCNKTASERPNLFYPIIDPTTSIEYNCNPNRVWAYEKQRMDKNIAEGKIIFPKNTNGTPMYKRHLAELRSNKKPFSSIIDTVINTVATKETRALLNGQFFDYPKSVDLMSKLLEQGTAEDSIVLDFFSGSATMAHAIMHVNSLDNGKRKFIMVQLPEVINEKTEAYKAGYNTIAQIGRERIRRAGKKIKEDNTDKKGIEDLDTGFRVLKVDSSNMKDVYYAPDQMNQSLLDSQEINIKEDRTSEDLLFQVLLDWGVDLTLPIKREKVNNKEIYFVDEDTLAACFEDDLDEKFVRELAKRKVMRVVLKIVVSRVMK